MHIISTNNRCTKWMHDNKNVQNEYITIKYVYMHEFLFGTKKNV